MKINNQSKGIKIEGHRGKWCVIDSMIKDGVNLFLLEHESYGDEADCLVVTSDGKIIADVVLI